ncbi:MAG: GNAT family N-acetyltransferase [Methylibium sp.]|nr:GNAT family N-acetyltransferase [Methylibium sp.]
MSATLIYRPACPADAEACVALRGQTRQNAVSRERLAELGITPASWAEDTRCGRLPGHVCQDGEQLLGYCFGDAASGEIVVLALLPDYEGQGIGRRLLDLMVQTLRTAGHQRLFLGCARDPATRSHGFYRHLGWRPTGEFDALGDEVLELTLLVSAATSSSKA